NEKYTLSLHDALPILLVFAELKTLKSNGSVLLHASEVPAAQEKRRLIALEERVTLQSFTEEETITCSSKSLIRFSNALIVDSLSDRKSTRLNSSHVKI